MLVWDVIWRLAGGWHGVDTPIGGWLYGEPGKRCMMFISDLFKI